MHMRARASSYMRSLTREKKRHPGPRSIPTGRTRTPYLYGNTYYRLALVNGDEDGDGTACLYLVRGLHASAFRELSGVQVLVQ